MTKASKARAVKKILKNASKNSNIQTIQPSDCKNFRENDFSDLLQSAHLLLTDRKEMADLIYWACKLDSEERAALIFAYQAIQAEEKLKIEEEKLKIEQEREQLQEQLKKKDTPEAEAVPDSQ